MSAEITKITHVIFDFYGTLVDFSGLGRHILNEIASEQGKQVLDSLIGKFLQSVTALKK